jgi:hypothetical protein
VAPISVVVATTHAGSTLAPCVTRLLPRLDAVGGELILADGSVDQDAVTADWEAVATVIRAPGADVFSLRSQGAQRAAGDVVAFTEDHCLVAPDWVDALLAAHAARPDVAAVAGPTRNGSERQLVDRANFLVTFAPVMPPLNDLPRRRIPPPNNISIKRAVLDTYDLTVGLLELELVPHLARVGQLVVDDLVVVEHIQSHGCRGSLVMHFHNGRTTTGLPRCRRPLSERLRRLCDSVFLVPRHARDTWQEVAKRPGQRRCAIPAMPWVVALLVAHAAGQICGVLAGPGRSPRALE